MFVTGEALEFVLGVCQTLNDVSNHVIIQDLQNSTSYKSRVITAPRSVSDWLFYSRAQVTTNQRTGISVELRQQHRLFQAQSQTSLKGRKNGVHTGTCC